LTTLQIIDANNALKQEKNDWGLKVMMSNVLMIARFQSSKEDLNHVQPIVHTKNIDPQKINQRYRAVEYKY
jgi:hypothetical protein